MIRCYTYYLFHIPTGKKYYGVRWANIALNLTPEEDFWNIYFSSSEAVQLLIEQHGKESFRAEIRKLFDTPKEAQAWEHKVLRRMKAVQREDWLNKQNYPEFYRDNSGEKHPMYGKSAHSIWVEKYGQEEADRKKEAAKKLMSIAHIGLQTGEKHPMYGRTGEKHPMYGKSVHSIWVEKYGQEEADRKKEAAKEKNRLAHIGLQVGEKNPMYGRTGEKHPMYGKHHTEAANEKNRLAHIGLQVGEKNPMYGKVGEKSASYIKRIKNNPYPKLMYKDGTIHEIKSTLKQFAKQYNLNPGHLSSVINGKLKLHKGWKLYNEL